MTRRNQYITGICIITPLWLIASVILALKLLGAEDPGLPIGEIATYTNGHENVSFDPNYKGQHQGEFPPVPSWLKTANVIAMPIVYVLPQDGIKGWTDEANGNLFLTGMFASSILWGLLIVSIFRLGSRTFGIIKNIETHAAV
jgi:hypothetical protein